MSKKDAINSVPSGLVRNISSRWELNNHDNNHEDSAGINSSNSSFKPSSLKMKKNIPQLHNKFFQEILDRVFTELEVLGFTVEPIREEGPDQTSNIVAVKVLSSQESNIHLIFKSINSSSPKAKVLRFKELFKKETLMYSTVVPWLTDVRQDDPLSVFPTCFHTGTDLIVLDDLSSQGFRTINHDEGLDAAHCKLVLTELARFHAAAYALKNSDSADMQTALTDVSQELQYLPGKKTANEEHFSQLAQNTIDIVRRSPEAYMYAKGVENVLTNIHKYLKMILQPKEPFAVLTHGDLWTGNLMFSYSREEPLSVKFLDFQTCRYGSPALDINYFLYLSTTAAVRDRYMDEFMRIYYQSLMRSSRALGLNLKLNLMDARKEVDSSALYGFLAAHLLQDSLRSSNPEDGELTSNGLDDLYSKMITEIVCDLGEQGVFNI